MHETRLVRDLIARIDAVGRESGASIESVRIEIGALSHITPNALVSHFEILAVGSLAEDADLDISRSEDRNADGAFEIRLVSVIVDR